jgi:feruloyl esterase
MKNGHYTMFITLALAAILSARAFGETQKIKRSLADNCDSLTALNAPKMTITSALSIEEGKFTRPVEDQNGGKGPKNDFLFSPFNWSGSFVKGTNPKFCRVTALLKPSKDSQIQIEVWLPEKWNGKFLGVGSFGWGGKIMYYGLMSGLQAGYAVANSDTGHQGGNDGGFSLGHPEQMIDYAYRATHEMTVNAKTIIRNYYGKKPKFSYWAGCSLGGLEGLIEAKRYPGDYNSMVIGAPPNPIVNFNGMQMWPSWLIAKNPNLSIDRKKIEFVHKAVLDKCATPVGKAQGFVDLPESCVFDPATLLCKNGQIENCLSEAEIQFFISSYEGPVDPVTKKNIFPGVAYGAENEIGTSKNPMGVALGLYKYFAFQDPSWDFEKINWHDDVKKAEEKIGNLLHVSSNELRPFLNKGGKIIFYLGWNDSHNPKELIHFVQSLQNEKQVKLFNIPGMGHCAGGEGCDTFNKLALIDKWTEENQASEKIITYKVEQEKPVRSRPICAYPKVAKYKGSGDIDQAQNFDCFDI